MHFIQYTPAPCTFVTHTIIPPQTMALRVAGLNKTNIQFIFFIASFPVANNEASPTQPAEGVQHTSA
jgi:hypothetical protein